MARPKTHKVTRLDYCQYLFSSQINYTLTNFSEHVETLSHDMVNRYYGMHFPDLSDLHHIHTAQRNKAHDDFTLKSRQRRKLTEVDVASKAGVG